MASVAAMRAVTMSTTRRTSVMSTSGVTLIPEISSSMAGLGEVREEHASERVGVGGDDLDAPMEDVERRHRGNGHGQADRRGHERLADAGHELERHRPARIAEAIEGHDDAD